VDPVTLIVTALTAGLASAMQDGTSVAVKGAYMRLRDAVRHRLAGRPDGELALARHETNPRVWEGPLRTELVQAGAEDDAGLATVARALMELVDADGARAGKYAVSVSASQGVQLGDHGTQTNTFGPGPA
jgi:hypothetical protein